MCYSEFEIRAGHRVRFVQHFLIFAFLIFILFILYTIQEKLPIQNVRIRQAVLREVPIFSTWKGAQRCALSSCLINSRYPRCSIELEFEIEFVKKVFKEFFMPGKKTKSIEPNLNKLNQVCWFQKSFRSFLCISTYVNIAVKLISAFMVHSNWLKLFLLKKFFKILNFSNIYLFSNWFKTW